ncbi:hypothetical protein CFELI_07355 [Corynebacterium felinum]|uniref:Uncharacterized protein n=1 Tax=Corynebacterium felinum TaxID=131318 RepID=A0ABU2BAU0_9CORY|nr:hypothetical protein [Corynebacterium felinum]WJY95085.1 hypothetical protein CFELI_07355 [Corynebacterium felinum]
MGLEKLPLGVGEKLLTKTLTQHRKPNVILQGTSLDHNELIQAEGLRVPIVQRHAANKTFTIFTARVL